MFDPLEETGLMDNTIFIRLADLGEGGLSHGMSEKAYTAYEEIIHIPVIIHNPKLFQDGRFGLAARLDANFEIAADLFGKLWQPAGTPDFPPFLRRPRVTRG